MKASSFSEFFCIQDFILQPLLWCLYILYIDIDLISCKRALLNIYLVLRILPFLKDAVFLFFTVVGFVLLSKIPDTHLDFHLQCLLK